MPHNIFDCKPFIFMTHLKLFSDISFLKIEEQLTLKYGKEFAKLARTNSNSTVNERVSYFTESLFRIYSQVYVVF